MSKSPKSLDDSTPSSPISLELLQKLEQTTQTKQTKSESTSLTPTTATPPPVKSSTENVGVFLESKKTRSALETFESTIGGRDVLIETLGLANLDKKQEHFLRVLCDPGRQKDTLARICQDTGILPSQVIDLFRSASFAKAHAIGMGVISERVPDILADIADKSVDRTITCPTCQGKENPLGICERCNGVGTVLRESDLDRQKIALEVSGLMKKGGGVQVQVNQQVGISGAGSFFSKYVKSSDEAAYDVTVEGEVSE